MVEIWGCIHHYQSTIRLTIHLPKGLLSGRLTAAVTHLRYLWPLATGISKIRRNGPNFAIFFSPSAPGAEKAEGDGKVREGGQNMVD